MPTMHPDLGRVRRVIMTFQFGVQLECQVMKRMTATKARQPPIRHQHRHCRLRRALRPHMRLRHGKGGGGARSVHSTVYTYRHCPTTCGCTSLTRSGSTQPRSCARSLLYAISSPSALAHIPTTTHLRLSLPRIERPVDCVCRIVLSMTAQDTCTSMSHLYQIRS